MISLLKKILGDTAESKIENSADIGDVDIALSVLLLEAAHVDGDCSADELETLTATLVQNYGVSRTEIDALLERGNSKRKESVDIFQFTRFMNNKFSKEERIAVMEAVWRVLLVDDHLEAHEDQFAHKLANLLRLTHKDLIDAKLRARQQLRAK
jgi:uncharacterized tellurite resistance protein B-like protein